MKQFKIALVDDRRRVITEDMTTKTAVKSTATSNKNSAEYAALLCRDNPLRTDSRQVPARNDNDKLLISTDFSSPAQKRRVEEDGHEREIKSFFDADDGSAPRSTPVASRKNSTWSSTPSPGPPLTSYPSIPYYALGNALEIYVGTRAAASSSSSSVHHSPAVEMGAIDRELQKATREFGGIWFLGTSPIATDSFFSIRDSLFDDVQRGNANEAGRVKERTRRSSRGSSTLRYDQYGAAMSESYARMAALQRLAADRPSSVAAHVLYLRIAAHPRFKDVTAMLSVENGKLLLFIAASSRTTQQYFTQTAVEAGVEKDEMLWIAGAVLLTGTARRLGGGSSLLVLWNILATLPLHEKRWELTGSAAAGPSEKEFFLDAEAGMPSSSSHSLASAGDMARRWLRATRSELAGFDVSLISSLPLPDGQRVLPALKLVETQPITVPAAASRGSGGPTVSGYRCVWRLTGVTRIVHPYYLTHLVRTLVEVCRLRSFDIRCGGGEDPISRPVRTGYPSLRSAARDVGASEGIFSFVRGAQHGLATVVERGSSTASSWQCCSRLSSHAWLSREELNQLGMVLTEEAENGAGEAEEVQLEGEFTLTRIWCKDVSARPPSPSSHSLGHAGVHAAGAADSECDEAEPPSRSFVSPLRWPSHSFQLWKQVTRIIDERYDE